MGKEKIKAEMEANKANGFFQVIGEYLLTHLEKNPDDASKLSDEKKTIKGSLEAMRKEAEKKQQGNMAVIAPDQGFKIISDYFEINGNQEYIPSTSHKASVEDKRESSFTASLSEFL